MTRIRNLARSLKISEDDLGLWLLEHAPELSNRQPAALVSSEIAERARQAFTKPAPSAPIELRCDWAAVKSGYEDGMGVYPCTNQGCRAALGVHGERQRYRVAPSTIWRDDPPPCVGLRGASAERHADLGDGPCGENAAGFDGVDAFCGEIR